MSEFIRNIEARKPVLEDMLSDLAGGLKSNTRLISSFIVYRAAGRIEDMSCHYLYSPDISAVTSKNPNIGQLSLFPEQDQMQIEELASTIGYMAIHDGFDTDSYPHLVYRRLLTIDASRVSPLDYATEIWSEDYASRMTDAMHIGIDHTLFVQPGTK
ncbi:hypothetical protein KC946_02660 [Candidatus Saccharibacteria bacterium]|nr:hypothetical protein [Candidatus Saccharibacteria bacterium]